MEQGRLKAEVVEFKRKRIAEVSVGLFFELGYEATTLDLVAERLKITRPSLYSYFSGKREILYEISKTGIRLSLAALVEALDVGGSPAQRLRMAVERVAKIVIEKRQHIVVYQREEKSLLPEEARAIRLMRKSFDKRVAELLNDGVKAGEFSMPDVPVAATTIGGILSWLPSWYVPAGRLTATEVTQITVGLVSNMVTPARQVNVAPFPLETRASAPGSSTRSRPR